MVVVQEVHRETQMSTTHLEIVTKTEVVTITTEDHAEHLSRRESQVKTLQACKVEVLACTKEEETGVMNTVVAIATLNDAETATEMEAADTPTDVTVANTQVATREATRGMVEEEEVVRDMPVGAQTTKAVAGTAVAATRDAELVYINSHLNFNIHNNFQQQV